MVSILALAARRITPSAHTEFTRDPKSQFIGTSELGRLASRLFPLTFHRYVQMLERQQSQLIAGIQILYQSMQNGHRWTGPPLEHDAYGQPLTHQILQGLGVVESNDWESLAAIGPCVKVSGSSSPDNDRSDTISPSSTDSPFFSMSSISRPSSAPQPTLPANPASKFDDPTWVNDTETFGPRISPPAGQTGRKQPDMMSQMPAPLSAYLREHHFEMDQSFESMMGLNWMHGLDDLVNATAVSGSRSNWT